MPADIKQALTANVLPRLESYACPICQSKNWVISETILELREYSGGGLIIGKNNTVMPVISAICHICGNILFFNAIHVGALNEDPGKKLGDIK
mgnify:CR=1 FL=1